MDILFSISDALAPAYEVITITELLSICGNRSIGRVIRENIPNMAIATNIKAVVIGFLTADEKRLISTLFYLQDYPE